MKTSDLRNFSDYELRQEIARREVELERRAVVKRIKNRKPIGYFYDAGGDELHADYEFHVVFSDKTKECWNFSTYDNKSASDRDNFRINHFPILRQMKWEEWDQMKWEEWDRKRPKRLF